MSNDPNVKETPEVVRPPIVLEGDAGASLAESDRDLGVETINALTEAPESIRQPIVIEVAPETEEEDGDRTPKNTNVETIEA